MFGIIFIGFGSLGMLAWVAKDLPSPDKIIERDVPLSTKIYDREGEVILYDIHGTQKRTFIKLDETPQFVKDATLTAEDRKFYEHKGISVTGILRSIIRNILTGSKVGGSTLTQQLIKNAILSPEKTYTRKIKEVILSYQIEKRFSKDEILQMYFNEIPYGTTAYGVEAAAQTYFGKSVREVSLAEAAVLAALTQAPTYYSPYGSHKDELVGRQGWILDSMVELGYTTEAKAEAAKLTELEFRPLRENISAPHFVMFIKEYLSEKYGEKTVEQGGLKVITTLDFEKQTMAEETITELAEKNLKYNASNAALVAIDTNTGQILAMVGSKDYFNDEIDGQVNVVTRPRQPGSSFKPIVYAAAFRKGYTPETVLFDVNTTFINTDGKNYEPRNYNLAEHGPVLMRQALAGSLNIPAVKTIYLTGIDNVLNLADELGYTTLQDRSRYGLSLVLGGGEVKLLEHVRAFAALSREGELRETTGILRVEDKDGNVLEEYKDNAKKVLETQVARQINNILADNSARAFVFGENNSLTLPDRPVAAKTGTTNDFRDAWTIGYTPSVAVGVWVGNNDFSEMKRGADGSVVAAPIWQAFMKKINAGAPVEYFHDPEPTTINKPALNGSIKEGIKVKIDRASGKLATENTPPSFIEEKNFMSPHSILYYVNKDDPQGPEPQNPDADPQYKNWEAAVQQWAQRQNITAQAPPTEDDDLHVPQNRPNLTIITPIPGQQVESRNLVAAISAEAPRGISRVEYYLAGKLIYTATAPPWSMNVSLSDPQIKNGINKFSVTAYDDIDNSTTKAIDIQLSLPEITTGLEWVLPKNNSIITDKNFPLTVNAKITEPESIAKIDLYFQPLNLKAQFINSVRQFGEAGLEISWPSYPGPGIYQIYGIINQTDGFIYESERIVIEVK